MQNSQPFVEYVYVIHALSIYWYPGICEVSLELDLIHAYVTILIYILTNCLVFAIIQQDNLCPLKQTYYTVYRSLSVDLSRIKHGNVSYVKSAPNICPIILAPWILINFCSASR